MKKILLLIVSGLLIACMAGSAMAESIDLLSDAPTTEDGSTIELLAGSTNSLSAQFTGFPIGIKYNYVSGFARIKTPLDTAMRLATSDEVTVSFVRPFFMPIAADNVDDDVVRVTIGPDVPVGSTIVVTVTGADNSECSIEITAVKRITTIPEFPTVALPVAAVIGLVFIFGRKKDGL